MLADPGLYVHLPWCVRKCPYCDFNSHPLKDDSDFLSYVQALVRDWRHQAQNHPVESFASVFIGGGTPSLCPADLLDDVLRHTPLKAGAEVTMEANPGTTEYQHLAHFRQAGINRLSIGAQSFNNQHLQVLGRIHNASETHQAFAAARDGGFDNINLDLMWGLPEQTVDQALADLDEAINLQPEHISWYQLTIEAKTEFARRTPILPVEDIQAAIEREGLMRLEQAGYHRYEVSAFATGDRQCRHNRNYWEFGDYMGLGAGAHGKYTTAQGVYRTQKAHQPRVYLDKPTHTQSTPVQENERVAEFMLNALRLVAGVPKATLLAKTHIPWAAIEPQWQALVDKGLVRPDQCATTLRGLRFLDSVIAEFV